MNKSLYSDNHPKLSLKGTGFKNIEIAKKTLKLIEKRSLKYQYDVINTMYNRAKYHPHLTQDMKDAMYIFKNWLKSYNQLKENEPNYKFLSIEIIKKYEKLAKEFGIKLNNKTDEEFYKVYKKVKYPYKLQYIPIKKNKPYGQDYYSYRNTLIKSKLPLIKNNLFYTEGKYKGLPTKQHIILIMHAFSPIDLK